MTGETLSLFDAAEAPAVASAPAAAGHAGLAGRLPPTLRLGTSSWSFPGWAGQVYAGRHTEALLAREGLAAYARHPLLRAVGLDRTYYAMPEPATLAAYARATPADFRFVVKAPERCTLARFHQHPRHGAQAGEVNPRFLDPGFALAAVVEPLRETLGERLGVLLFQFPPQGGLDAQAFRRRLDGFLDALPSELPCAVELRDRDWLTQAYLETLAAHGVVHCLSVHPRLPPLAEQWRLTAPLFRDRVVLRWNLQGGYRYEEARARYAPFDRLCEPDPGTRADVARLCREAGARGAEVFVTINNKAEGSAPASVVALAEAIVSGPA